MPLGPSTAYGVLITSQILHLVLPEMQWGMLDFRTGLVPLYYISDDSVAEQEIQGFTSTVVLRMLLHQNSESL